MTIFEQLIYNGCNTDGVLIGDTFALKQFGIYITETEDIPDLNYENIYKKVVDNQ